MTVDLVPVRLHLRRQFQIDAAAHRPYSLSRIQPDGGGRQGGRLLCLSGPCLSSALCAGRAALCRGFIGPGGYYPAKSEPRKEPPWPGIGWAISGVGISRCSRVMSSLSAVAGLVVSAPLFSPISPGST